MIQGGIGTGQVETCHGKFAATPQNIILESVY